MYFAKPEIVLADPANQFKDIIPIDTAVIGEHEIGTIVSIGNSGASSVGNLENLNVSVESDEASVSTNDVTVVTGNRNSAIEERDRVETIVKTVEEDYDDESDDDDDDDDDANDDNAPDNDPEAPIEPVKQTTRSGRRVKNTSERNENKEFTFSAFEYA